MKTHIYSKVLFTIIFLSTIILGCAKSQNEEDNKVYSSCLVTKISTQGLDTGQYSLKFGYDNQDRIVLFDWAGPNDMLVSYQPGKIITNDAVLTGSYSIYYLNSDSTAYASASYGNGQRQDSNLYYYDTGKYLIKSVRFTQSFGKDSSIQTYTNGNLTKIVIYNSNGTSSKATVEYNDLPNKFWMYQHIGPYANNSLYMPWLGKPNRNLIKTFSSEFNGNPDPVSMNYEMNVSGYLKSHTMTFQGSVDTKKYEYKCR